MYNFDDYPVDQYTVMIKIIKVLRSVCDSPTNILYLLFLANVNISKPGLNFY